MSTTPTHTRIIQTAHYTPDAFDREMNRLNNSGTMSVFIGLILSGSCAWTLAGWQGLGVVFGMVLFVAGVGIKNEATLIMLERTSRLSERKGEQQ